MARPKPIGFEVKKSAPFNGKEWRVTGYLDGKRKQFWFATEREARREAADRNREREAYGSKVNLDAEARLEALPSRRATSAPRQDDFRCRPLLPRASRESGLFRPLPGGTRSFVR